MIAFEIDGKQHLLPQAIEHDRKRDAYLRKQGWTVMRLSAKRLKHLVEK
jgi:very-short-patch-repair endonuclease